MKATKAEINAKRRAVKDIVNMEGWPYLKTLVDEFIVLKQNELFLVEGKDKDAVMAKGYESKFGTEALVWFFKRAESIKKELDNNR